MPALRCSNKPAKLLGEVHLHFTIKPRQVEEEFYAYAHLISDYDADGNQSMDLQLVEITHTPLLFFSHAQT